MKDLKLRTKEFEVNCWKLCCGIPHSHEYNAFVNQLIRSSSSVGANNRAASRNKSTSDFINKLKIVEEEADESMYFLELLLEVLETNQEEVKVLHAEANEIVSIVVSSINTALKNQNKFVA